MNLRTASFFLATLLAACSSSSTAPKVNASIAGSWTGTSATGFGIAFTITDSAHIVAGNGTMSATGLTTLGLTINGTHTDTTFSLNLVNTSFQTAFYTGVVHSNQLIGVLNNSGFSNEALTMTRP